MSFIEVLRYIDEQIREIEFVMEVAADAEVMPQLKTSRTTLVILKDRLIKEANSRQEAS